MTTVVRKILLARAGIVYEVPADSIHEIGVQHDDLVLDVAGEWVPAVAFSDLHPLLVAPAPKPSVVATAAKGVAIFGGAALVAYGLARFADWLTTPTPTPRRSISSADRDAVARADGWKCAYCGTRVTRRTRHIDHAVSLANGGEHDWDNWVTEFEGPATGSWRSAADAVPPLFAFIEAYYNATRLHSFNNYKSPNESEADWRIDALAA